jgi:hypothetical protein
MNKLIEKNANRIHVRKPLMAVLLAAGVSSFGAPPQAATLPNGSLLSITNAVTGGPYNFVQSGSYFGMNQSGDTLLQIGEKRPIISTGPIQIGSTQTASGSHTGGINGI